MLVTFMSSYAKLTTIRKEVIFLAKHTIRNPLASTMLGDPAVVVSYATGLTSDKKFGGQPYSEVTCLAPYLNGEIVRVNVPGVVEGMTTEMVQDATCRLSFLRVKFSADLVLEVKGREFNSVTYEGTAQRAALVQPGAAQK